jgi:hypothetical protein
MKGGKVHGNLIRKLEAEPNGNHFSLSYIPTFYFATFYLHTVLLTLAAFSFPAFACVVLVHKKISA